MESGQNLRKRNRLVSLFKRKEQIQQTSSSPTTSVQTEGFGVPRPTVTDANTGDKQRSKDRYFDATRLLEETVKAYQGKWGSFDFPELKGEPEDFNDSLFREKINTVMIAQKTKVNDQSAWEKCRDATRCAFIAFSPFAKNFLTIAKEGQAVFITRNLFLPVDPNIEPLWIALRWSSFIDHSEIPC